MEYTPHQFVVYAVRFGGSMSGRYKEGVGYELSGSPYTLLITSNHRILFHQNIGCGTDTCNIGDGIVLVPILRTVF